MPAPYNNIRSKLNRAIVAWLLKNATDNTQPAYNIAIGTTADVLPANTTAAKTYPNTTVRSAVARPFPVHTGSSKIQVVITIKGSAASSTRTAFDTRVAATKDALMLTNDNQSLHYTATLITAAGQAQGDADMADFTCEEWEDNGDGDGEPDPQGADWVEHLMFEAVACGSALG